MHHVRLPAAPFGQRAARDLSLDEVHTEVYAAVTCTLE